MRNDYGADDNGINLGNLDPASQAREVMTQLMQVAQAQNGQTVDQVASHLINQQENHAQTMAAQNAQFQSTLMQLQKDNAQTMASVMAQQQMAFLGRQREHLEFSAPQGNFLQVFECSLQGK